MSSASTFSKDRRQRVDLGAVLGPVRPHAGGDVAVVGPGRPDLDAVLPHQATAPAGQALGVPGLR